MSVFKSIDKYIGLKCYSLMVKFEARYCIKIGITEPPAITTIIYDKHHKEWKSYGVTRSDISRVVEEFCRIKPVHGLWRQVAILRATNTIKNAVKQKRIKFLGDDKLEYTDRIGKYCGYRVNFKELEQIFIETTRTGFKNGDIVDILNKEYQKGVRSKK